MKNSFFNALIGAPNIFSKKARAKELRNWVLTPSRLGRFDLAMPTNAPFPRFKLPVLTVKVKRNNRAAQTNRICESKAAAKILNFGPRIRKVVSDDINRMEAQNTIERKREEKAVRIKNGNLRRLRSW